MQLVSALAAGVSGAESGHAEIYARGTSSRSGYYTEFEALESTSTADVSLDSNGRAVVYVSQLVTVQVYDSDGVLVTSFVEGSYDDNVEVRSTSFTGTAYDDATSAVGNPLSLGGALDKLVTSFGTTDFNVLVGGSSTTLQSAIAGLSGVFVNVQDSAYGATGDGSTDDTTAIAAALTAAATGGGAVYFPPGTYRITSSLAPAATVSLMGAGPGASVITMDDSGTDVITLAASVTYGFQRIAGLRIASAQSNSGNAITTGGDNYKALVDWCYLDGTNFTDDLFSTGDDGHAVFSNCWFKSPPSDACILSILNTAWIGVMGCHFIAPATCNASLAYVRHGQIIGCHFDLSAITSGTLDGAARIGDDGLVAGCYFSASGGGTETVYAMQLGWSSGNFVAEHGNVVDCATAYYTTIAGTDDSTGDWAANTGTRKGRKDHHSSTINGGTETLLSQEYEVISGIINGTSATTLTAGFMPEGSRLVVCLEATANTGTITWDTAVFEAPTFSMATGSARVFEFVSCGVSSNLRWVLASDSGDVTI